MLWQGQQDFPRLQILTVGDLLEGKRINYPAGRQTNGTFKKAPKAKGKRVKEADFLEDTGETQ